MLIRRTPTKVFGNIIDEWNRAVEDKANGLALALDVHENDDAYTVVADIPGVSADDISIQLHEDVLTISAETNQEKSESNGNVLIQERHYGKISRSLRFPIHVNRTNVEADYNNGVLTISVPKAEDVKPHRIAINTRSK
ncbi:MAG: Hsp20/alpha crystallin family protein [Anaerolineae bacterium]|nr:Hsp20/alpha crystallin family protein [Anaerolineae bacterium]